MTAYSRIKEVWQIHSC